MQAGDATSQVEVQRGPRSSVAARPNGPKEGPGTPGRRDRAAHELDRARNWERGAESWKRTQREEGEAEGEGGMYSRREKQQGNRARTFPD
jgi:hypothetical protein